MDSVDLEVLRKCADWVDEGRRTLLVTVVKTWGSSPRPEGAMLAVREDGHVVGSVSGGCIEDDIVDRTRREGQRATKCEVVTYGVLHSRCFARTTAPRASRRIFRRRDDYGPYPRIVFR